MFSQTAKLTLLKGVNLNSFYCRFCMSESTLVILCTAVSIELLVGIANPEPFCETRVSRRVWFGSGLARWRPYTSKTAIMTFSRYVLI